MNDHLNTAKYTPKEALDLTSVLNAIHADKTGLIKTLEAEYEVASRKKLNNNKIAPIVCFGSIPLVFIASMIGIYAEQNAHELAQIFSLAIDATAATAATAISISMLRDDPLTDRVSKIAAELRKAKQANEQTHDL